MGQFPSWAAGQRITAAVLTSMSPMVAVKPATTSINTNTVVAPDPDLTFALVAGTYSFSLFLSCTGAAIGTGDLKMTIAFTGTSTGSWGGHGLTTASSTALQSGGNALGSNVAYGLIGGTFVEVIAGGGLVASTAGTLSLNWAQNTSNATNTNVRLGSMMQVLRAA